MVGWEWVCLLVVAHKPIVEQLICRGNKTGKASMIE